MWEMGHSDLGSSCIIVKNIATVGKGRGAHSKLSELLDQRICCQETITTLESVYNRSPLELSGRNDGNLEGVPDELVRKEPPKDVGPGRTSTSDS